ncbi:MAG: hypothetical protein ACR5KV_06920 [Wolbachia sp.]
MKRRAKSLERGAQGKTEQLYLDKIEKEVKVLRGVEHPYAVKVQIINVYSLLEIATGKADGIGSFQLRKLRNYLAHGDVLASDQDDKILAEKLIELKILIIKRLDNSKITFRRIENLIDSLQSKVNKGKIDEAIGKIINDVSEMLCSKRKKRSASVTCIGSHDEESPGEQKRREERIKELFDTNEIRKEIENAEFYNQLSKIAKQISAGEVIDRSIEKAFVVKIRNMNLNLIDPEIRNIVEKIKRNINDEKINKKEIRTIFTRSGIVDNIGKVAEKANLVLATFLLASI